MDTSVFIWLTRGKRERVEVYAPYVTGKRIVLSFVSVAELWRGAYERKYSDESRRRLEADIGAALVVAATNDLTHAWARLTVEARALGHALGQPAQVHDAWIAATARLYGLDLLTDDSDFRDFPGLDLIQVTKAS